MPGSGKAFGEIGLQRIETAYFIFRLLAKPNQGPRCRFRSGREIVFSAGTRAILILRESQWVTLLFSNQLAEGLI